MTHAFRIIIQWNFPYKNIKREKKMENTKWRMLTCDTVNLLQICYGIILCRCINVRGAQICNHDFDCWHVLHCIFTFEYTYMLEYHFLVLSSNSVDDSEIKFKFTRNGKAFFHKVDCKWCSPVSTQLENQWIPFGIQFILSWLLTPNANVVKVITVNW